MGTKPKNGSLQADNSAFVNEVRVLNETMTRHAPWIAILGVLALWTTDITLATVITGISWGVTGEPDMFALGPWVLIVMGVVGLATVSLMTWFVAAKRPNIPFTKALYLSKMPRRATALCIGLSGIGAVIAAIVTQYFSTGDSMMARLIMEPGGLLSVSIMAVMFAPLTEELYYRGFLFPSIQRGLEKISSKTIAGVVAFGVVTLWFTGVHVPQLVGDLLTVPVILMMSALWTAFRWRTNSLWPSLLGHTTYNFLLVLMTWLTWENP